MEPVKENAQAAQTILNRIQDGSTLDPMQDYADLRAFLQSCHKRLPSRAAWERDKERKRRKAVSLPMN